MSEEAKQQQNLTPEQANLQREQVFNYIAKHARRLAGEQKNPRPEYDDACLRAAEAAKELNWNEADRQVRRSQEVIWTAYGIPVTATPSAPPADEKELEVEPGAALPQQPADNKFLAPQNGGNLTLSDQWQQLAIRGINYVRAADAMLNARTVQFGADTPKEGYRKRLGDLLHDFLNARLEDNTQEAQQKKLAELLGQVAECIKIPVKWAVDDIKDGVKKQVPALPLPESKVVGQRRRDLVSTCDSALQAAKQAVADPKKLGFAKVQRQLEIAKAASGGVKASYHDEVQEDKAEDEKSAVLAMPVYIKDERYLEDSRGNRPAGHWQDYAMEGVAYISTVHKLLAAHTEVSQAGVLPNCSLEYRQHLSKKATSFLDAVSLTQSGEQAQEILTALFDDLTEYLAYPLRWTESRAAQAIDQAKDFTKLLDQKPYATATLKKDGKAETLYMDVPVFALTAKLQTQYDDIEQSRWYAAQPSYIKKLTIHARSSIKAGRVIPAGLMEGWGSVPGLRDAGESRDYDITPQNAVGAQSKHLQRQFYLGVAPLYDDCARTQVQASNVCVWDEQDLQHTAVISMGSMPECRQYVSEQLQGKLVTCSDYEYRDSYRNYWSDRLSVSVLLERVVAEFAEQQGPLLQVCQALNSQQGFVDLMQTLSLRPDIFGDYAYAITNAAIQKFLFSEANNKPMQATDTRLVDLVAEALKLQGAVLQKKWCHRISPCAHKVASKLNAYLGWGAVALVPSEFKYAEYASFGWAAAGVKERLRLPPNATSCATKSVQLRKQPTPKKLRLTSTSWAARTVTFVYALTKLAFQPLRLIGSILYALKKKQLWKKALGSTTSFLMGGLAVGLFVFFQGSALGFPGLYAALSGFAPWGTMVGLFAFASLTTELFIGLARGLSARNLSGSMWGIGITSTILMGISVALTAAFWNTLPFSATSAIALNIGVFAAPLVLSFLIMHLGIKEGRLYGAHASTGSLFSQVMAFLFSWKSDPVMIKNQYASVQGEPASLGATTEGVTDGETGHTSASSGNTTYASSSLSTEGGAPAATTEGVSDGARPEGQSAAPARDRTSFFSSCSSLVSSVDPGEVRAWGVER